MSLRARLLVGLVALATVGLLVANIVTYTSLRSFLNERVHEQLEAARQPVTRALLESRPRQRLSPAPPASYPSGTYGQVRARDGTVLGEVILADPGAEPITRPALPDALPGSSSALGGRWVMTVAAEDGSTRYRIVAWALQDGGTLVVAVPMREMDQTLRRLLGIMLAVGAGVLLSLAALAWWVVRVGLRPLERIGDTAADIAAGDLSRRVDPADEHTEVGRLGLSLNAMLAHIENAFAERTATEERLRRFLADASHELRTPLTSIRGYAELFRRGADTRPDDLAKAMERIEAESARMGVLVEDLLLLARLDEGRPPQRRPVDLTMLAADAIADARAVDPDRQITLASPGPVVASVDESQLRQVTANLLSNALTHTPAGTPVEVAVSAADGQVGLEVIDHGPGLPPEVSARAFERFYRSDPSRSRDSGGAGLGLSIVAAVAEAHGGSVSVASRPGEGAIFRVRLPAGQTHSSFSASPEVDPRSG